MLLENKIKVGIIDSGIKPENKRLLNMTIEGATMVPQEGDNVLVENEYGDESGHGTNCAEIIASITPEISLYVVKVLNEKNEGYGSALIDALEWMVTKKVDVINLSLGTTNSKYLEALISVINLLNAQNTVLVSAAFWKVIYPAAIPSVIAVADDRLFSTIPQDQMRKLKIDFVVTATCKLDEASNRGNFPDSGNYFGASFAAPYVTGLVALIRKSYPNSSPIEVYRLLSSCAEQRKVFDFHKDSFLREILKTHTFSFDKLRHHRGFQEKAKLPKEVDSRP